MPVCLGCGSSYEDQFQFCPFCGRAKPSKPELAIAKEVTIKEDSELACPRCHKSDKVEKISSIIAHQTSNSQGYMPVSHTVSSGIGYIGSVTTKEKTESHTKTNLATQLAYPMIEPKPEPFSNLIIGGVISLIIGVIGIYLSVSDSIIICLVAAIPALFISIFACIRVFSIIEQNKETLIYITENHRRFQDYKDRWSKVFYCYRDDSVFIPGEDDYSSVEDLEEFVKKI